MQQAVPETLTEPSPLISVDLPLQIDDIRATELSTTSYDTPHERHIPRQLIIEELGKTIFKAQIVGYRLGTYRGRSACLLVMRFAFVGVVDSRRRIRNASIEVLFNDAPLDISTEPTPASRPVLQWPRDPSPMYLGREEEAQVVQSVSMEAKMSPMSMAVAPSAAINFKVHQSVTQSNHSQAKISSECLGDPPFGILWTLEQNPVTKRGVARDFTAALVLENSEKGMFCVRVKVRADMGFRLKGVNLKVPAWGFGGDPVYFDPEEMGRRGGPVEIGDRMYHVAGDFADEDLKKFTRILFPDEEGHQFTTV